MGFSRREYWSGVPLPSPQDKLVAAKPERVFLSPFKEDKVEKPRLKNSQINNKRHTNMISRRDRVDDWGIATVV